MIKVAVVGSGYWGKHLVRNFHALGALSTICDKDPKVLTKLQKTYHEIVAVHDYDHLLDGFVPPVDAIVIATPAETHYGLAKKGLLAGKHVFVEKPLSLTVEEGLELVELAEQDKRTLMVGHILYYHKAVIRLKELIDSGELGKIQYIYSNRLNIGKIRAEENILWSFAPHDISVILMLLKEMPETVYATGGSYLQHQIPDTTLTTLDFRSGVKAHIFVSWLHPFKEQKLIVVGDKKMAVFDDVVHEKLVLYPHKIQWLHRIPVAARGQAETVPVEMDEPLRAECQHFLECIIGAHEPRTDGREGLRVLQVLQASQESLNQNGSKIKLAETSKPIPLVQKLLPAESTSSHACSVECLPSGVRSLCNRGKAYSTGEPAARSYFVHESSYIDDGAEIGTGTKIWHFSHLMAGTRIGEWCNIGQNVVIGPDVTIGNGCKIQNNVSVYKGVTLERDVFCGPSVVFTNVYNPRAHIRRMAELRPTLVKKGATLGANCTIVCGNCVGKYALVGAGAVITKNVPEYALMIGNPARQIGWVCECGRKLGFEGDRAKCSACSKRYRQMNGERIELEAE